MKVQKRPQISLDVEANLAQLIDKTPSTDIGEILTVLAHLSNKRHQAGGRKISLLQMLIVLEDHYDNPIVAHQIVPTAYQSDTSVSLPQSDGEQGMDDNKQVSPTSSVASESNQVALASDDAVDQVEESIDAIDDDLASLGSMTEMFAKHQ